MTTPSVSGGPPGNWAYPSSRLARLHTQMFKYLAVSHGSTPPVAADFTVSLTPNEVLSVLVRVMPVVVSPAGSSDAKANWMLASATNPSQTAGTLDLSGFWARKSWFNTEIWLSI